MKNTTTKDLAFQNLVIGDVICTGPTIDDCEVVIDRDVDSIVTSTGRYTSESFWNRPVLVKIVDQNS